VLPYEFSCLVKSGAIESLVIVVLLASVLALIRLIFQFHVLQGLA
jgi:hypothetical protein